MRRSPRDAPKEPRDRMQLGRLQGFLPRQLRQDRRQPPREHRLPGAGRPHHQQVVATGSRDLQGPARLRLTAHLGEVDGRGGRRIVGSLGHLGRRPRAAEEPHGVGEGLRADHAETLDLRGLHRVRARHHDPLQPRPRGRDRDAEDAGSGEQLALQGDLARERQRAQPVVGDLAGRRQHAHHEWEIESGALLADVRRREVHDDAPQWPLELRHPPRRDGPVRERPGRLHREAP